MKRICSILFVLSFLWGASYAEPSGWVSSEERSFICGDAVQIAAHANQGYLFDHWSDGATENPRWIEVLDSRTYTAYFVVDDTPTAIDNIENSSEVRKVLINDKVYIIRGEHIYDTLGKQVR